MNIYMAKIRVVSPAAAFQVRRQISPLLLRKRPGGKIRRQINHLLYLLIVRPHNPGVIAHRAVNIGFYRQRKTVLLIFFPPSPSFQLSTLVLSMSLLKSRERIS